MTPLNQRLKDWVDFDGAAYELGVVLGVFEETPPGGFWLRHAPKWVFWTDNSLGNTLHEMLEQLVGIGMLEKNDEDQYRWNGRAVKNLLEAK